jgi:hypothetical protein
MNGAYNEQQFGRLQQARNAAQSQVDDNDAPGWMQDIENFANSPQGKLVGADDDG